MRIAVSAVACTAVPSPIQLAADPGCCGRPGRRYGSSGQLVMAGRFDVGTALTRPVPNMPAVASDQAQSFLGSRVLAITGDQVPSATVCWALNPARWFVIFRVQWLRRTHHWLRRTHHWLPRSRARAGPMFGGRPTRPATRLPISGSGLCLSRMLRPSRWTAAWTQSPGSTDSATRTV